MKIAKIALTLVSLLFTSTVFAGGDAWMTDFDAAKAKAKEEQKYLLLDFTGSDWCGWCIKLDKEVFSKEAFQEYASDKLVLVELDFPRNKKIDAETKAQNEELAKKYKIRGFPTIILLSPEGEMIAQTGYQAGGAEKYVDHLQKLIEGSKS